jgi:hypothetical protein
MIAKTGHFARYDLRLHGMLRFVLRAPRPRLKMRIDAPGDTERHFRRHRLFAGMLDVVGRQSSSITDESVAITDQPLKGIMTTGRRHDPLLPTINNCYNAELLVGDGDRKGVC